MKKKGFTLIELMIVIAIIAILAAILVPNFLKARAQGQLTQCQSNCKNIGTALEMYSTDSNGHYPANMSELTSGSYMRTIPTCASVGSVTYTSGYDHTVNPDAYTFYCDGKNHESAGADEDFPRYNSCTGLEPRKAASTT